MSKKDKAADLVGSILNGGKGTFSPTTPTPVKAPANSNEDVRFTFLASKSRIAKLKAISAQTGVTMKAIMDDIIASAIDRYEARHGAIEASEGIKRTATGLFND